MWVLTHEQPGRPLQQACRLVGKQRAREWMTASKADEATEGKRTAAHTMSRRGCRETRAATCAALLWPRPPQALQAPALPAGLAARRKAGTLGSCAPPLRRLREEAEAQ